MVRGRTSGGIAIQLALFAMLTIVMTGCSARGSRESSKNSLARLITHNGFSENGLSTNGLTENGFSENGFSENGFSENGFSENGLSVMQILESDPNAVDFVRYAYSCAMAP